MSSGIAFRNDEETVRLAQVFVDGKCAVETPPEGMFGHGQVVGAFYVDQHTSYAILFADGHEHGGYGEKWWGNRALPPLPDAPVPPQTAPEPTPAAAEEAPAPRATPVLPLAPVMSHTVVPEVPGEPAAPAPAPVEAVAPVTAPAAPRVPYVAMARAPRIVTVVPFAPDGDLGRAYNDHMKSLGEDDWACFLDHDAVHTTRRWYEILEKAVQDHPHAGLFGAVTNRVGSPDQELPGVDRNDHDMVLHRRIGTECAEGRHASAWPEYIDMDHPGRNWLAGVLMLTSKRAWKMAKALDVTGAEICGFREGYLFGVDNEYHRAQRAAGNKVYLLSRLYVYHWYRANRDEEHVHRLGPTRSYRQ